MSDEKEAGAAGESGQEPFLRRWSRRKAEVRSGAGVEPDPSSAEVDSAGPTGPEGEAGAVGEAIELPDLDTLGEDSDYSAFMSPGVDADLRRKALRKLFASPKFNVIDDMDDYCGDFTQFESLGGIVTADMKHQMERLARAAADALNEDGKGTETAALSAAPAATPSEDAASDAPAAQPEQEKEEHDGNERPA
jgi:hypothetical protein